MESAKLGKAADDEEIEMITLIPDENRHGKSLEIFFPKSIVWEEVVISVRVMFNSKVTWLFLFGPIAVVGQKSKLLGESICFCFAGLSLVACAERISLVTEHIAEHTNGTIGALINATLGNIPEFLISSAALQLGFYRVVQLTLLGSILTNLLFVFGTSCFIGGLRWKVQEIRITSGNVSIGMLLLATMGLILPATLILGNESDRESEEEQKVGARHILTHGDVEFSRVNSLVMIVGYIAYLIFQLGTHKEEFDYSGQEYAIFGGGHNIVRTPHYGDTNYRLPPTENGFYKRIFPNSSKVGQMPALRDQIEMHENKNHTEKNSPPSNVYAKKLKSVSSQTDRDLFRRKSQCSGVGVKLCSNDTNLSSNMNTENDVSSNYKSEICTASDVEDMNMKCTKMQG
mmetsp:Transcript_9485/g.13443  ORF Transcript_9485/g.13443 Transcript_9485/m.13443 type:complete len:401 (-) Transcript_9485:658-1860(-)